MKNNLTNYKDHLIVLFIVAAMMIGGVLINAKLNQNTAKLTSAAVGTWSTQTSGTTEFLSGIHFADANNGWVVGTTGTILKTTDGGTSWNPQVSGTTNNLFDISCIDASTCWVAGIRNPIFGFPNEFPWILKTTTGGAVWFLVFSSGPYPFYDIHFVDANNGWATSKWGLILSTSDGGATWVIFQPSVVSQNLNGVHFVDANTGWIVGNSASIVYTTDGGTSWNLRDPILFPGSIPGLNDVHFVDSSTGWAVGSGGTILKSTDGGVGWDIQTSGTTVNLFSVYFVSDLIGWIVGDSDTILYTNDGGTNWTSQVSGTTWEYINDVYADLNTVWAVGGNGTLLKGVIPDGDNDQVPDTTDNCPTVWNKDQLDTDGDGDGNECDSDDDDDGLTDAFEASLSYAQCPSGTNPLNPNTDGDTNVLGEPLNDGFEVFVSFTDPCNPDTDDDGAFNTNDGFEWYGPDGIIGTGDETDPLNPDTDGDGLTDGLEVDLWLADAGLDPLSYDVDSLSPAEVIELQDAVYKTSPPNEYDDTDGFDVDGDSIPDGQEDTDGDGTANVDDILPADATVSTPTDEAGNILVSVTSNTVHGIIHPGQKPLKGAVTRAYLSSDSCVKSHSPNGMAVSANCETVYGCRTHNDGQCSIFSPEGSYFVVVEHLAHPGKFPAQPAPSVKTSQVKKVNFSFLAE